MGSIPVYHSYTEVHSSVTSDCTHVQSDVTELYVLIAYTITTNALHLTHKISIHSDKICVVPYIDQDYRPEFSGVTGIFDNWHTIQWNLDLRTL